MTNRREFLGGLGALVGVGAVPLLTEPAKTAIAATPSLDYKVGLGRHNGSFRAIDAFERVDRETIAKFYSCLSSSVPVYLFVGTGTTEEEAQKAAWDQIEDRCRKHLAYVLDTGLKDGYCFLYAEKVPLDFIAGKREIEVGYHVALISFDSDSPAIYQFRRSQYEKILN